MSRRKLILLIAVPVLIAVVAGGLWMVIYGPVIIRDRQYRDLIADFQRAERRNRIRPDDKDAGWAFEVQAPEKQTTIRVQAGPHMAVVRVKYQDEGDERALYQYVDYSHPQEIRTAGNVLYVYWTEILLDTKRWLLAYDLVNRREIVRRRLDPHDLGQFN